MFVNVLLLMKVKYVMEKKLRKLNTLAHQVLLL